MLSLICSFISNLFALSSSSNSQVLPTACPAVKSIIDCKLNYHSSSHHQVVCLLTGFSLDVSVTLIFFPPSYTSTAPAVWLRELHQCQRQCWSSQHRPLVRIIGGRYYSNDPLCMKEWKCFPHFTWIESLWQLSPQSTKISSCSTVKTVLSASDTLIHIYWGKTDCFWPSILSWKLMMLAVWILTSVGIDDGLKFSNESVHEELQLVVFNQNSLSRHRDIEKGLSTFWFT